MQVKGLQKPDHQRCHKNNGKGPLQKILCLVPEQMSNIFGSRHPIVWQLHDKRNRFSLKQRTAHEKCHQNPDHNSAKIQCNHHKCPVFREKCRCEKRINRQLCRTAHKRRQQNRHFPVPGRGQCPARHNARHGTSKPNQHRHNASAGKTDFAQQLVHHKRNPRHISTVLQQRQKEKQRHNDGQKAQHASDAIKNTVHHKGMNHIVYVPRCHVRIYPASKRRNPCIEQI